MIEAPNIDLHTHSNCSDGTLAPADLVQAAAAAGVEVRATLRTIRWRHEGREVAEAIWNAGGPVLVCFWHSRIPLSPACWPLGWAQEPRAVISLSPDGEFIAKAMERLSFGSIRGSFLGGIFCGVVQQLTALLWNSALQDVPLYVLLLFFIRLVWRLTHRPPPFPADYRPWEGRAAHAAHIALYVLIIAIPLTGWIHDSAWKAAASHPMYLYWVLPWFRLGFITSLDPATKESVHHLFGEIHTYLGYVL